MYICAACRLVQPPKTPALSKVLETRDRVYLDEKGLVIAKGTEIVREIRVCPACAAKP